VICTNLPLILHRFQVTVKFSLARGACLTLMPSLGVIPVNIAGSDISVKTVVFGLYICRRKYRCIFKHFNVICPATAVEFGETTQRLRLLRRSRSFKVTDFGTNRKLICDFLLVVNSNLPPILHRFRDSLGKVQNLYIWLPLFGLTPPPRRRGSSGTISLKFFIERSQMVNVPNDVEILPKIAIA